MFGSRKLVCAVGFLSIVVLASADSQAQDRKAGGRGGMMGGGMAGPGLVMLPVVQKELKMTPEQAEKAKTFGEEYRQKGTEMMSSVRDLEPEARMKKTQEHFTAGMKDVEGMLKPEQTKRFKQIVFQARGLDNLNDPEVTKDLKVTGEQSDKLKGLMAKMQTETRDAMQDSGGDREAMAEARTKIRKEFTTKAMALMTPEQKTMYKEMAGEPFELPAMGGRPAR